jgi:hypothetical protein
MLLDFISTSTRRGLGIELREAPPVPGELLAAWLLGSRFRIARPKSYPKG